MSHHKLHTLTSRTKNIADIIGPVTTAVAVTATKALRNLVLIAEEKRCERVVGWIPQIFFRIPKFLFRDFGKPKLDTLRTPQNFLPKPNNA
jgi:hypothetical protein